MTHRTRLPKRLKTMIPVRIREDWLGSYRDLSGVETALSRLAAILTNGDWLPGAIEEIKVHCRKPVEPFSCLIGVFS
jgi:acyl carrier protein phosphodiesterase